MRAGILVVAALAVFLVGIGLWSFHLTAGLGWPTSAGMGAVAFAGLGGVGLIALFLWLRTRR